MDLDIKIVLLVVGVIVLVVGGLYLYTRFTDSPECDYTRSLRNKDNADKIK